MNSTENKAIRIFDTKRENNLIVHLTDCLPDDLTATFTAEVDMEKRRAAEANHTATHLLHEALREVLGTHVEQKGSYVSPEMLRFDFSHFQKMTKEEICAVEHLANRKIRDNCPLCEHRDVPINEARQMGAMALFGEKYGETVRVINFGTSTELCGGTHVQATGNIGMVRILSETSIAAGVRRIEAITGAAVENAIDSLEEKMQAIQETLNAPDVVSAIKKIKEENAELSRQLEVFKRKEMESYADKLLAEASTDSNGTTIVCHKASLSTEEVKTLTFILRNKQPEKLFVVIGSVFADKPSLTVLFSDDLVAQGLNAVNIIRTAAKEIQGGGGGQPFFAQAGGKNAAGIDKALEVAAASK